jgi:hypothetical protein
MINLDENYKIYTDKNNFILVEIKKKGEDAKNPGEEREVLVGYYGTLEFALKGYINHNIKNDLPDEILTLLNTLQTLYKNIENTFKDKILIDKESYIKQVKSNNEDIDDNFEDSEID